MDPDYDLFVVIMDTGSLSAAGRQVGLSPAMVSKRLRRLEDRLGTELLHRSTRKIAPTSRGQLFYEDLLHISALLRKAEDRISINPDVPAGPLHISAPTSFGRMHFAPYMAELIDRFPRLEIQLDLSDDFVDLAEHHIDVAIRITEKPEASLVAHRLASSERVLCASPTYIENYGEPKTIADIHHHRLLAASGQLPWRLTGPKGEIQVGGSSHISTNSSEVVRELAIAGAGIALRSLWDVKGALDSGALQQVLPDMRGSDDIAIYALHRPSLHPHPAVNCLVSYLKYLYGSRRPW